jgi:hypothetical protein
LTVAAVAATIATVLNVGAHLRRGDLRDPPVLEIGQEVQVDSSLRVSIARRSFARWSLMTLLRTTLALAAACVVGAVAALTPWHSDVVPVQAAGVVLSAATAFALVYLWQPRGNVPAVARPVNAPYRSVFLSYRRSDGLGVGRLYERLRRKFGDDAVIGGIQAGLDFRDELANALDTCRVGVVVIGSDWEFASDDRGGRKLEDPRDFVVIEVVTLLHRGVPLIPVLTERERMPNSSDLPDTMSALVFRQALKLRPDPDFDRDADALIAAIEVLPTREPPPPSVRKAPTGAPREGNGARGTASVGV